MIRIYSDFNNVDVDGKLRLNTVGSLRDLEEFASQIRDGMLVTLYMEDVEVEGRLEKTDIFRAVPDWSTLKNLDSE